MGETFRLEEHRGQAYNLRSIQDDIGIGSGPRDLLSIQEILKTPPTTADRGRLAVRARLALTPSNVENLKSALDALGVEFAEKYDLWLQVGFGLHDFEPSQLGLALWKRFSFRCANKALQTDFDRLWSRFEVRGDGAGVSIGTVLHHAKQAGWKPATPWERVREAVPC